MCTGRVPGDAAADLYVPVGAEGSGGIRIGGVAGTCGYAAEVIYSLQSHETVAVAYPRAGTEVGHYAAAIGSATDGAIAPAVADIHCRVLSCAATDATEAVGARALQFAVEETAIDTAGCIAPADYASHITPIGLGAGMAEVRCSRFRS